jgi:hypothetical protein
MITGEMAMSTEDSILERLNALEKQNRWMKRIGVAAIVIAASLLVMGQKAAVNRTIEANEFLLRDSNGTVRSKWVVTQDGPRLLLLDGNGKERVVMYCNAFGGGGLGLGGIAFPGYGGAATSMGFIGPTDKTGPLIMMTQAESSIHLATREGNPLIGIEDKEGFSATVGSTDLVTERTGETHQTSAASVILFGKDKKILWKAP